MVSQGYEQLQEALDYYEEWINFWAGIRQARPVKPKWLPDPESEQVKLITQRIVKAAPECQ